MACEKPVLSTPLKGTIELLPDERYGISYSDNDLFVNKMVDLLKNHVQLEEMGKSGYAYVQKNHLWESLSTNLLTIFSQIILNSKKH